MAKISRKTNTLLTQLIGRCQIAEDAGETEKRMMETFVEENDRIQKLQSDRLDDAMSKMLVIDKD